MANDVKRSPGKEVAYRAATRFNDYETARQLQRTERDPVAREESGYVVRGLKNRFEAGRKKKRSSGRGGRKGGR